MLGKDADTAWADEQTHDNEDDAGQNGPADEGDDPPYDEYHGYEPQDRFHGRCDSRSRGSKHRPLARPVQIDLWLPQYKRRRVLTVGHKTKNGPGRKRRILLVALPWRSDPPAEVGKLVGD